MTETETELKSSDGDTAAAIGIGLASLLAIFAVPPIVAYVKQSQPKPLSFTQLQLQALREATTDPGSVPGGQQTGFESPYDPSAPVVPGSAPVDVDPMGQWRRVQSEAPLVQELRQQEYERAFNLGQLHKTARMECYPQASLQPTRDPNSIHDTWTRPSRPLLPRPAQTSQFEPASY